MTDSYQHTLTALLREERDANRIHRAAIDRLTEENARALLREERDANRILKQRITALEESRDYLRAEVCRLTDEIMAKEREETERLGTFPAPPRSKLGVTG